MLRFVALALVPLLASAISCSTTEVFTCSSDDQCVTSMIRGQCEAAGVCSFPDLGCDSGRRYGMSSGDLSGQCVDETASSSGSSGDMSTTSSGGTPTGTTVAGSDGTSSTGATSSGDTTSGSTSGDPHDSPYPPCIMEQCQVVGAACVPLMSSSLCAPRCVLGGGKGRSCPSPLSGSAIPNCIEVVQGSNETHCILVCSDIAPCPDGMICDRIDGDNGICGWE